MSKEKDFLSHMPHKGWTIVHLRAASHGAKSITNTHPFVAGPWAIAHNGVWSEYNIVKLALSPFVKFEGDTDSEVAAHLFNLAGPKEFTTTIDSGGVWLALNRNGALHVSKTSGLLVGLPWKKMTLIATELNPIQYEDAADFDDGWFTFSANGTLKAKEIKQTNFPYWQRYSFKPARSIFGGRNEYAELAACGYQEDENECFTSRGLMTTTQLYHGMP